MTEPPAGKFGFWVGVLVSLGVASGIVACVQETTRPRFHFLDLGPAATLHRYQAVPSDRRTTAVEYVEDRVFTGVGPRDADEFNVLGSIAIADNGTMYVVDSTDKRVLVLDQNGTLIGTLGGPGQGPGETERPGLVAVSGDLVWLAARTRRRFLIWSRSGDLVGELPVPGVPGLLSVAQSGLGDGSILVNNRRFVEGVLGAGPDDAMESWFSRLDPAAGQTNVYAVTPVPPDTVWRRGGQSASISMLVATPRQAVDAARAALYLTPGDRYEVAAFGVDGTLKWALSVGWVREPIRQADKQPALEFFRKLTPDAADSEVSWPEYAPAIDRMMTDSDGHLHVYPHVSESLGAETRPVDIYDSEGQLLHTALAPNILWDAAWKSFVYEVRPSEVTGGHEIVRYRMRKPTAAR